MSLAVNTKECMFFVGGNDYKSNSPAGSSYAGGCTKHWWKSELQRKITISGDMQVSGNGLDMSNPQTGPIDDYVWDGTTWLNDERVYKSVNQHPDGEGGQAYYYFYWDGDQWRLVRIIDDWVSVNPRWSFDANVLDFTRIESIWAQGTFSTGTVTAYFPELKAGDNNYNTATQSAMEKLMGTDGEPLMTSSNSTITNNGSGKVRIANSEPWPFFYNKGIEAGMLIYCNDVSYLLEGEGVYEIIAVDPSGYWVDINQNHLADSTLTSTIDVGGAWDNPKTLSGHAYAYYYSQEIWVNKDITFGSSDEWLWRLWGHGNKSNSSFLLLKGFHRVPGDLHRPGGNYFQSISDVKSGSVDSDCWVNIDLTLASSSYPIDPANSENIIFTGFRVFGHSQYALRASTAGSFDNIIARHNLLEGEVSVINGVNSLTLIDNYIYGSGTILQSQNDECVRMFANIIESITTFAVNAPGTNIAAFGNLIIGGANKTPFLIQKQNYVFAVSNTLIGGTDNGVISFGGELSYPSEVVSLNNILLPAVQTASGYHQSSSASYNYGSLYADNDTVYVKGVGVVDELAVNELSGRPAFTDDCILQVDPLLNSENLPRNKNVLIGGIESGGQRTTIGAVSQEHQFVSRSTKSNPGRLGIIR